METQSRISAAILRAKVGKRLTVLIDEVDANGAIARSSADAPEIDGKVYIDDATGLKAGDIVKVVVGHAGEHDLHARRVH